METDRDDGVRGDPGGLTIQLMSQYQPIPTGGSGQLAQVRVDGLTYLVFAVRLAGNVWEIKVEGPGLDNQVMATLSNVDDLDYIAYRGALLAMATVRTYAREVRERTMRRATEIASRLAVEIMGSLEIPGVQHGWEKHAVAPLAVVDPRGTGWRARRLISAVSEDDFQVDITIVVRDTRVPRPEEDR